MHRVESQMEADREKPKMPEPQFAVQQPAESLRIPVVEACEERVEETANQNVMKVSDDEVRIRELPIERNNGQHHSSQTRNQKLEKEAEAEEHRHFQPNLAAVHRAEPVEDLDPGRNPDEHR